MNSYPIYMNYKSFYSSHIALSYDIIVYMNNLMDHGMLPSYIFSGIQNFHGQYLDEFLSVSYELLIIL